MVKINFVEGKMKIYKFLFLEMVSIWIISYLIIQSHTSRQERLYFIKENHGDVTEYGPI